MVPVLCASSVYVDRLQMIELTCLAGSYPPGWYELRACLLSEGCFVAPMFTPYDERGYGLSGRLDLTRYIQAGGRTVSATILLDKRASRCVFADGGLDCSFKYDVILKPVSKVRAGARMVRALISRSQGTDWISGVRAAVSGGMRGVGDWLQAAYHGEQDDDAAAVSAYRNWLERYDALPVMLGGDVSRSINAPRISVLVPVYDPRPEHLQDCIDSVLGQRYPHWELCLADDASTDPRIPQLLLKCAAHHSRVRFVRRESNGGIAAATHAAFELSRGEIVALLDHDDLLHPDALAELASAFSAHPEWGLVYTDEDKIDAHGVRSDPYFKPDFDQDLLCGHNCVSHMTGIRREIVKKIGGFRGGFDGSQDWDMALRAAANLGVSGIGHVPRVLYHWRVWEGSTAASADAKPYARDAALRAIEAYLTQSGQSADVVPMPSQPGNYRVTHRLPEPTPRVSVLIPTRDQPEMLDRCLRSVEATRGRIDCEYLVMDNGSERSETIALLRSLAVRGNVRVLRDDSPFNFSSLNNRLAEEAAGEVLLFLNDDVEALSHGWLEEMVAQALRPEVGAVGAKLHYPDGRLQHAGIFLGVQGIAANAYRGCPGDANGHMNRALLVQGLSAVTAACLAMRRSVFREIGGFDTALAVAYNDVDLCLRARSAGYRVVWTPFAELLHHESVSRAEDGGDQARLRNEREEHLIRERWAGWIEADPAYNLNLELATPASRIGFPPRRGSMKSKE